MKKSSRWAAVRSLRRRPFESLRVLPRFASQILSRHHRPRSQKAHCPHHDRTGNPTAEPGQKLALISMGVAALAAPVIFGLLDLPHVRAADKNTAAKPIQFEVVSIRPEQAWRWC